MKKILLILAVGLITASAMAQENRFTLSGGYVFTNVENTDVNATGFRINGLYEFVPMSGNLSHGFNFGYINTSATYTSMLQTSEYKLTSWPFYYAPKYQFGKESFKVFLKGALGMHSSRYERSGALGDFDASDFGFYGGAGLGLMKIFKEKVFINLEYEWAYLSNSYYADGFINSLMGGIGLKF